MATHNPGATVRATVSYASAVAMRSRTASASLVPSASPFSKSPAICPIVFVTWARQRTLAFLARAKA